MIKSLSHSEPIRSRGRSHRVDRHNINTTPEKAYKIFKDKVPKKYQEFIKDAVKDHVEMDLRNGSISRGKTNKEGFFDVNWEDLGPGWGFVYALLYGMGLFFLSLFIGGPILLFLGFSAEIVVFFVFGVPFVVFAYLWHVAIKGSASGKEKSKTRKPDETKERTYECITCGVKISKQEYEENEEQCDNCVAEDTIYAGHFPELGFE